MRSISNNLRKHTNANALKGCALAALLTTLLTTVVSTRAYAGQSAIPFPDESADPNEAPPSSPTIDKTVSDKHETDANTNQNVESANADSEESARFGAKGGVVLTGATDLSGGTTGYNHSDASSTSLSFNPSFDYFLAENVSIGLTLPMGYSTGVGYGADGSSTKNTTTSFGIGARLGYNAVISERFSLYLLATLGGGTSSYDEEQVKPAPGKAADPSSNTSSVSGFWIDLYAPLLFHLTNHLFAGLGPYFYQDLTRAEAKYNRPDNLRTSLGASLMVGGWF